VKKRHLLIPRVSKFRSLIIRMHLTITHEAITRTMSREWNRVVILAGMFTIQITWVTPGCSQGSHGNHEGDGGRKRK